MPPSVYARLSPMSDRMNALLLNPFYLVESIEAKL